MTNIVRVHSLALFRVFSKVWIISNFGRMAEVWKDGKVNRIILHGKIWKLDPGKYEMHDTINLNSLGHLFRLTLNSRESFLLFLSQSDKLDITRILLTTLFHSWNLCPALWSS